jgi:hypothetical protein
MFLLPRFVTGEFPVPNPGGAAGNLGQVLGLTGLWSVAPLAALWAAAAAVAWRAK